MDSSKSEGIPKEAGEYGRWWFHDTPEPLTRYLRDRRQKVALQKLRSLEGPKSERRRSALVVCGGVGGEGTYLRKHGFSKVTVSEINPHLIKVLEVRDPQLSGVVCDAQKLEFPDGSFDLVLVQDGIHHLRNPVLGVTEMLRVARDAVLVIEPHTGFLVRLFGTKVEREGEELNYVFRWNKETFEQVVSSYLVGREFQVSTLRFWDHSLAMLRLVRWIPSDALKLKVISGIYWILGTFFGHFGNMFIGIMVRKETDKPK